MLLVPGRAPPGLSECAACRRPTPSIRFPRPSSPAALGSFVAGGWLGLPACLAPSSGLAVGRGGVDPAIARASSGSPGEALRALAMALPSLRCSGLSRPRSAQRTRGVPFLALRLRTALFVRHMPPVSALAAGAWAKDAGPMRRPLPPARAATPQGLRPTGRSQAYPCWLGLPALPACVGNAGLHCPLGAGLREGPLTAHPGCATAAWEDQLIIAEVFPDRAGKNFECMGIGRGCIGWPKSGVCGSFGNPYIPKCPLLRFGLVPCAPVALAAVETLRVSLLLSLGLRTGDRTLRAPGAGGQHGKKESFFACCPVRPRSPRAGTPGCALARLPWLSPSSRCSSLSRPCSGRRLRRPPFLGAPFRAVCADASSRRGPAVPLARAPRVRHGRVPPLR